MSTSSIQLRADGRVLSSRSHALTLYPRRRWRTIRSYAAMAWEIVREPVSIIGKNVVGLAILTTVCAGLWVWS